MENGFILNALHEFEVSPEFSHFFSLLAFQEKKGSHILLIPNFEHELRANLIERSNPYEWQVGFPNLLNLQTEHIQLLNRFKTANCFLFAHFGSMIIDKHLTVLKEVL